MKTPQKPWRFSLAVLFWVWCLGGASLAGAADVTIVEQSVRGLGSASASGAALAEDGGTIFFNPAGMAYLSGQHIEVGRHYILPQARISLGGGIRFHRAGAALDNPVDVGKLFAGFSGTTPQGADGYAAVAGEDWGYGFNLGLIYAPAENSRLGLAYRSEIRHRLEGTAELDYPNETLATAAAAPGVRLVEEANADVDLPATVALSAAYAVHPQWVLLADVTWTQWRQLEGLRIRFDSGAADNVTTLDLEDTWRYSIGTLFKADDRWHLRAGLAFDETPLPIKGRRTPPIPDDDRIWTTIGSGYRLNPLVDLNLSYAHLFIKDPAIDGDGAEAEDLLRGALGGEYDAGVDIISLNLQIHF